MAKYTREQRQRAVGLYVEYECCAADVIRELGYPSREALRMWHRDWLDEQETGVSSQRGERYARYTEEQRRAAVDHYLTHGRRASRTMRQMGGIRAKRCLPRGSTSSRRANAGFAVARFPGN